MDKVLFKLVDREIKKANSSRVNLERQMEVVSDKMNKRLKDESVFELDDYEQLDLLEKQVVKLNGKQEALEDLRTALTHFGYF